MADRLGEGEGLIVAKPQHPISRAAGAGSRSSGDFNAQDHDTELRLACAGEDNTGSGHLAPRVLTPVARSLPADRRFTVLHHGRPEMLDHILASRSLFASFASVEIHNEMLDDELIAYGRIERVPDSLHAPVVASFDMS
jgi:hypothetical protein